MINSFRIRRAKSSDAPEIRQLLRTVWLDTYSHIYTKKTLNHCYENWHSTAFLAKQITDDSMYFPIVKNRQDKIVAIATAAKKDGHISSLDKILIF